MCSPNGEKNFTVFVPPEYVCVCARALMKEIARLENALCYCLGPAPHGGTVLTGIADMNSAAAGKRQDLAQGPHAWGTFLDVSCDEETDG